MISKRRQEMGEDAWAEHQRIKNNEKAERYRTKNGHHVVNWHRRTKKKLIEYKGGKCIRCGYDKDCPGAYHFHHRDPSAKEFGIGKSGTSRSLEKLKTEADKCDLLCSNCHAEKHDEEYIDARNSALIEHDQFMSRRVARLDVFCPQCKIGFRQVWANQIHCCEKCAIMARRKADRPSKEELQAMLATGMSWVALGRKFGVTDNAVRKWAISDGTPIPERAKRV